MPGHLSHPASAWPEPARERLPGAAGMYGSLGLLACAGFGIAVALARAGVPQAMRGRDTGARWAGAGELGVLRRRASGSSGRLTLGRHRGRVLRAEQRHALVAFGPPQ